MLYERTISRLAAATPGLSQATLQSLGLEYVRRFSGRVWTDHNVHDPGITILELLCYALTDLEYRANFPIEDLLATESGNESTMAAQFFTPGPILTSRALTETDYRKLVIDLPGVKNAWIIPAPITLFADTVRGELRATSPETPGVREVSVRGRYEVLVEYMDGITTDDDRAEVHAAVLARLSANRSLCEDFNSVRGVPVQPLSLCTELELETDADVVEVVARVQFLVQRFLAPPVRNYSLSEMLARTKADGSALTLPEIFEGPWLDHGFIPDEEVLSTALREEVHLSDVISVIMDIPGVRAVRDIVMNLLDAEGAAIPPVDPWVLPMPAGMQPRLSIEHTRIVTYKKRTPLVVAADRVQARRIELQAAEATKLDTLAKEDRALPRGRYRSTSRYRSFQLEFPEIYGLSAAGLDPGSTDARRAQALQLKAYLLHFDQVMANYLAQLANVREVFARNAESPHTYFAQAVRSIPDVEKLYRSGMNDDAALTALFESTAEAELRRDRLLDHLLARCAEDFHDYVAIERSTLGTPVASGIAAKKAFLNDCPVMGSERSLAYDYRRSAPDDLWDSTNVSGLERRLSRLLGMGQAMRRSLASGETGEGMHLVENLLLLPETSSDPFLPICADPNCTDCADDDPYSYRVHFILPAYAGRFVNMDFRRFVEETIRLETPAHILPKICWVDREDMERFELAYRDWLEIRSGRDTADRAARIATFVSVLFSLRNVYPEAQLQDPCANEPTDTPPMPPFVLGRTVLGTQTADGDDT